MLVGLDRLPSLATLVNRLRAGRVGVLAHPASVNRDLSHVADVLAALDVSPRRFFGPEHGYGGEAQDMVGVASAKDPRTGAPIVSLYGDRYEDLFPRDEHLDDLDLLVIDLADVGARYYTFVWTALMVVREAAKHGVHCVLLDRPNPIGGEAQTVEGELVQEGFDSFVGYASIPVRHSLTVGEIVAREARKSGIELGPDGGLSLVAVEGWDRAQHADAWDRPFVMTSPNMPTYDTALVYPGGCLLEGTNLSEGRGTTRPFELFGAPWLDGQRLAESLHRSPFEGFRARPVTFLPMFQKHGGQICGGVQIHVTNRSVFRPYATYLAAIGFAQRAHPSDFEFRTERYEYVDDIPAFDLLTGSAKAREAMLASVDPIEIASQGAKVSEAWPEFTRLSLSASKSAEVSS